MDHAAKAGKRSSIASEGGGKEEAERMQASKEARGPMVRFRQQMVSLFKRKQDVPGKSRSATAPSQIGKEADMASARGMSIGGSERSHPMSTQVGNTASRNSIMNPLTKKRTRRNTGRNSTTVDDTMTHSFTMTGTLMTGDQVILREGEERRRSTTMGLRHSHNEMLKYGMQVFETTNLYASVIICPAVAIASAGVVHLMLEAKDSVDAMRFQRAVRASVNSELTLQCLAQTSSQYLLYTASGLKLTTLACLLSPPRGVSRGPEIDTSLTRKLRNYYRVDAAEMQLEDAVLVKRFVNEWGESLGHGYMDTIGDDLSVVLNADRQKSGRDYSKGFLLFYAVYTHVIWQVPFTEVRKRQFTGSDGVPKTIGMMHQVGNFRHAVHLDKCCVVVGVPVGRQGKATAYFILPTEGTLASLEQRLNATSIQQIMASAVPFYMSLCVPRFRVRSCCSMMQQPVVMPSAVGGIYQYVDVKVDDVGLEPPLDATKKTRSPEQELEAPKVDSGELIIDCPFLFTVQHNRTNAIYLHGRVYDPSAFIDTSRGRHREQKSNKF